MKNIQFLFYLLLSSVTLHSMDKTPGNNENDVDSKKIIKGDFKNYLTNLLPVCKKKTFTFDEMTHIEKKYVEMTNKESFSLLGKCLHRDVCDEEGNTFAHYATKNREIKILEWIMSHLKHPLSMPNKIGKEPIDLCIDQLMPGADEKNTEEARKIFTILTTGYDKASFNDKQRQNFANKIVALKFAHAKNGTNFELQEDILKRFGGENLSEIYQKMCDKEGNTFAHIFVQLHLSDKLYEFIEKNYISFAQNEAKEDPLALAQRIFLEVSHSLFQECGQNKDFNVAAIPQKDIDKKCCYHMLLNHRKKQDFKQCCGKHII